MSSVYSEVTATYSRDRVLEKFDTAQNTLPFTLDEIKISHNDLLLAGVYNDSISKLYSNYLYLIANAEITTKTSPTSALSSVHFNDQYTAIPVSVDTTTTGTALLSTINEIHYVKRGNTEERVAFAFGTDNSLIFKHDNTTITSLLTGNKVEYNKQFEFSNVVAVDSFDNFLFVLDKGNNTLFKFDVAGFIYSDPPVERTGLTSDLPGRFLIKTIGGKGKVNRKNKLTNPSGISIFNNYIYVLDNGNFTIKVFDLNFNFITSYTNKEIFDYDPISITVSRASDLVSTGKIFILGKSGVIVTLNTDFTNLEIYNVFGSYTSRLDTTKVYKEKNNFRKIISSPSENNILYIVTNKSVVKFYKTNLSRPISFYDMSLFNLNSNYEFVDSLGVDSISGVDNLLLFSHLSSGETKFSIFKDKNETNKLYHDNFYTNYFSLSDISIKPQELVNAISFNKTTEKIAYNHSSLFENLNKKIYSYYADTRVPEICTVVEATYTIPSNFEITSDFYIGVNEPLLTDIINRPITKLYNQQVALFDIIKESYLNNNPPENIAEVLPSSVEVEELPIIKFDPTIADLKVLGGNPVRYTVIRNKSDRESKFKLYTTTGTDTLTSDYGHIDSSDPMTLTLAYGVSSIDVAIDTISFYSGNNKSFDTFIYAPSGGIIDQNNYTRNTTITASGDLYTVNLSSVSPIPVATENGSSARFAVTRSSTTGTFYDSISVNIYTSNGTASNSDFDYITTDNTYKGSASGDYTDFSNAAFGQVSATTLSGGTVIFSENVSAVFFDVSANSDTVEELHETFEVNITNPSEGSNLGPFTTHLGRINEELIPLSLTVDSTYPTNYNSTGKLSGVNVWYLLSADTTYQTYSANKALDVSLTITAPLTVYSPSADRGAIFFDNQSTSYCIKTGSTLTVNIPQNSLVIGKGGDGGTGLLWLSGEYFEEDAVTNPVSTTDGEIDTEYFSFGMDGGPAISLSAFTYLTINNSGSAFGGAGGGGAGYLPVSANPMPEVCSLSASSGGGGGAGIEPNGYGLGGIIHPGGTFDSITVGSASFVYAGSDGSVTGGGAGGNTTGINDGYDTDNFSVMDGAYGGGLGRNGCGGDQPDNICGYPSSYDTVSDNVLRFAGGQAGQIVSGTVNWYTQSADLTSGTFSGSNI